MNKDMFKKHGELLIEDIDMSNNHRYLDYIQEVTELKDFVIKCYHHAGKSLDDIEFENRVAGILLDHLIRKGLLVANKKEYYVDTLLVSCYLHRLYFKEDDISSLFKARAEFDPIADEMNIPEQIREMIWQGIEEQLGESTPIQKTKPSPDTPQNLLAECIFIAKNMELWSTYK